MGISFYKGELVSHPHDTELLGFVQSQNHGSVIVRWQNGDVDSVGAQALDSCRMAAIPIN